MLDLKLNKLIDDKIIASYEKDVKRIDQMIKDKSGAGNDYIGWADWPVNRSEERRVGKEC